MKLAAFLEPTFPGALAFLTSQKISATVAFRLRAVRATITAAKDNYEATRIELAEKYANKDVEGKAIKTKESSGREIYQIEPEALAELNKSLAELQQVDVPVPAFSLSQELGNMMLSVNDVDALGDLLKA